jgi:hypothetical protein
MTEPEKKADIVAVMMGMGHLRAAYPLRNITDKGILIYGSEQNTPKKEYWVWKRLRTSYYFFSRAGEIPFIGNIILKIMLFIQCIEPYYPRCDHSKPNVAVKYLEHQIIKKDLCKGLTERLITNNHPTIHTYFATAIAADILPQKKLLNYLLICDSDFNRIWVPKNPEKSNLNYLAPCTQVKRRLMSYGVPENKIFLTGFPLPKENIGTEKGLEILKNDLFARLLRLDPIGRFFGNHEKSVMHWLDVNNVPEASDMRFSVMFAIGGAGAQTELACTILQSLSKKIREGRIRFILSAGIQKRIYEKVLKWINEFGLEAYIDKGLEILFDTDPQSYLNKFNMFLHETDVLWTKPSELVFYSGLGLPVVMAPPIGTHEELNKRWLQEIHAGVKEAGPAKYCDEWLSDLRESGRLAEAAWDGFLKVRKLGTYKIEHLIQDGIFTEGRTPIDQ